MAKARKPSRRAATGPPVAEPAGPIGGDRHSPVVVGRGHQRRLDLTLVRGSIADVSTRALVLSLFANVDPTGAAHYDLGSLFLELDRTEEAIAEFRASLKLTPDSVQTHNNLGIALGIQGRLDEAIDHFQRALAIKPDFEDARRNLALAVAQKAKTKG